MDTPPHPASLAFGARVGPVLSPGTSHVWSPHSLATVLCLLAHGARGRTRAQLEELLGADPESRLAELDPAVADEPGLALAAANEFHVRADARLRPEFRARLSERTDAGVYPADFAGDPSGVRARINDGVARVTRGLITDLLAPEHVTPMTMVILLSVLWVKAEWVDAFRPELTRERPFHTPDGTRAVPTMHRSGSMPYAEAPGWRMVTLAGHHGLELDVLLPEGDQETPDSGDLAALNSRVRRERVQLALPRFRVESRYRLRDPLTTLGSTHLFGGDYGGITSDPLVLSDIIHQAVFTVDERGAEGAAATVAVMPGSLPAPATAFTVDRPFVFLLRRRGSVLFQGRVTDPVDPGPAV
ncbi:serpin B [Nocardiopsis sp. Huas11]|uniref:serpin family protein n=1 Tax=Nocardiopsis sp. Huas11 TaxID=2183912 RepID=UPI000EB017D7|nr:serpin family protein [Nocardiopsis sp. Huas11]RKS07880.1 serpin B [Nocardiopsis sp. Huas11]